MTSAGEQEAGGTTIACATPWCWSGSRVLWNCWSRSAPAVAARLGLPNGWARLARPCAAISRACGQSWGARPRTTPIRPEPVSRNRLADGMTARRRGPSHQARRSSPRRVVRHRREGCLPRCERSHRRGSRTTRDTPDLPPRSRRGRSGPPRRRGYQPRSVCALGDSTARRSRVSQIGCPRKLTRFRALTRYPSPVESCSFSLCPICVRRRALPPRRIAACTVAGSQGRSRHLPREPVSCA